MPPSIRPSFVAGPSADVPARPRGEHAGQDGPERSADAVDAERVERIVVAERRLELAAGKAADQAGDEAHDQRGHRINKAGGRRDAHQPGDQRRSGAEHGRLAAREPLVAGPGHAPAAAAKCVVAKALDARCRRPPTRCRR